MGRGDRLAPAGNDLCRGASLSHALLLQLQKVYWPSDSAGLQTQRLVKTSGATFSTSTRTAGAATVYRPVLPSSPLLPQRHNDR
jgi:hypothetical protein